MHSLQYQYGLMPGQYAKERASLKLFARTKGLVKGVAASMRKSKKSLQAA